MTTPPTLPPLAHAPSVWEATAPPPPPLAPLDRDLRVDCAVIGGGYTGLNAALHLSRRGAQTCVLEANDAGWGASGRNGGMAVLRYKLGWSALARKYGDMDTRLLHRLVLEAVDALESNVRELGLDGGFARCGHLTPAYTDKDAHALRDDVAWLAARAGDRTPRFVDVAGTAGLLGGGSYRGGYLDTRAAAVHPMSYARELAGALARRGIPIHVRTPATRVHADERGCTIETPAARVRADTVIVASNAYTSLFDLPPELSRRVVPVATSVIATAPLPDAMYATLLPAGHLATDTRHLVNYFRRAPGQRILFGGRGSLTGSERPAIYRNLVNGLHGLFPTLRDIPIEFRWSGKVAVTLDDFPHLVRHGPRVFFAAGYGGRGVALTHLLGRLAAEMALGATVQAGPMNGGMPVLPLHGLRLPVLNLMAAYYKLRDRLRL
jgi:glycine/D-amino acid oxidase-like deaminating enzyme